jgi:hypothetical protein
MQKTSSRGNKFGISAVLILAVCISSLVGTYRLKKSAELALWKKSLAKYSAQLEQENEAIKNERLW